MSRIFTQGLYPLGGGIQHAVVAMDIPEFAGVAACTDGDLIAALEESADALARFAERLQAMRDEGWHLQWRNGLFATLVAEPEDLERISTQLPPGTVIGWTVAGNDQALHLVGGSIAGYRVPKQTFPGSAIPTLVLNELTGTQRIAEAEPELRVAVADELRSCSEWWLRRAQDYAVAQLVEELEKVAEDCANEPLPVVIGDKEVGGASKWSMRPREPRTRISLHPISAIVLAGVVDKAVAYSPLTAALPNKGHARRLREQGHDVASKIGVATKLFGTQ